MKIILIRHGETDEKGLSTEGKEKALQYIEFIKSNGIEIDTCKYN